MFGWLTAIPTLLNGVLQWLNKKQDIDLEKYKVDGQVNVTALETDARIAIAVTQLQAVLKDDPFIKWSRGILLLFTTMWFAAILWDSIFRNLLPDWATWRVLALPDNIAYMPYAVVGYLLIRVLVPK